MVDRIKQIMEFYQLTPASFAEQIGINRSNLTHLFSGRNHPSLELAKKILHYYPEIKTEWLIMGVGEMLKNNEDRELALKTQQEKNHSTEFLEPDLFNSYSSPTIQKTIVSESSITLPGPGKNQILDSPEVKSLKNTPQTIVDIQLEKKNETPPPSLKEIPKITQIVFFYSDKSFEVFQPK
jgi:transcriptional regulator with XRE-family HTH domain